MENAPEIIAWLAIMAAATATTNVGQYKGSACYKGEIDSFIFSNYGVNDFTSYKINQNLPGILS